MQNIELNKRDFFGYGKSKPKINWPDNNKLALSIVVNIEEGAELSVSSGSALVNYDDKRVNDIDILAAFNKWGCENYNISYNPIF